MNNISTNTIIQFLSNYAPISKDLEQIIIEHSGIRTISKNEDIIREGQIAQECLFVLKGCIKKYYLIDGEEKISNFYTEGQVVTPNSYTDKKPSKYFLTALEDTIALSGDPENEQKAIKQYPELGEFIGKVTEKLMVNISDELDNRVNHSPEERYLMLSKERPDILQRVPQYQIASYLGIKPESLSRIRKRLKS